MILNDGADLPEISERTSVAPSASEEEVAEGGVAAKARFFSEKMIDQDAIIAAQVVKVDGSIVLITVLC